MRLVVLAAAALAALAVAASAQTVPQRIARGALVVENVPETPPAITARLRQYVDIPSVSFADWLPGGGMLVLTRRGETEQLHRLDRPLGELTQLTFADERIVRAAVQPGADDIVFTRDAGGDENFAGYVLDAASGDTRQLTAPGTRNDGFIWSDDGAQIAWSYAPNAKSESDVHLGDGGGADARRVSDGEGAVSPLDFSPDGRRLLMQRFESIAENRLFVLDVASNGITAITPAQSIAYTGGEFTPDGRSVITLSDENAQFQRLVRIDLATGRRQALTLDIGWGIESFDLSPDGRTIAYVVNEAGRSRLQLMEAHTLRALPAPELGQGVISTLRFDPQSRRLAFTLDASTAPSDVYSWDLRARRLTRWTQSESAAIPNATFGEPELIAWQSFDHREISGFLYRPRTPGPHPVIIDIHGGPERQFRPSFSSTIQYWVNELGVAVIAPNVRGSDGYGRDFLALDNGALREDSVRDIGALLDWIATQDGFDHRRVAVYGASYGGYMALASMTQYGDRLAGGVDVIGVSDFSSFLTNTSGYRRDLRRAEYGDERDPAMRALFARISPINNAALIDKPLLVIHGRNDPRVPVSEAEQLYAAVRGHGGEAWLMIAANEGHGFTRRENQQAQHEAEALFFRHVLQLE